MNRRYSVESQSIFHTEKQKYKSAHTNCMYTSTCTQWQFQQHHNYTLKRARDLQSSILELALESRHSLLIHGMSTMYLKLQRSFSFAETAANNQKADATFLFCSVLEISSSADCQ